MAQQITSCDWCGCAITVPANHGKPNHIAVCSQLCGQIESWFVTTYTDHEFHTHDPHGNWIKEAIKWTKPANGSWSATALNASKWSRFVNVRRRRCVMLKEKPFQPLVRKVRCDTCCTDVNQFNALRYKGKFYCCLLCRGTAEYADRVKTPSTG